MNTSVVRKCAIALSEGDSVANVLDDVSEGETVFIRLGDCEIVLNATSDIPKFHKIALSHIHEGHEIIRGGYVIGIATSRIAHASWVHTHNLRSLRAGERPA